MNVLGEWTDGRMKMDGRMDKDRDAMVMGDEWLSFRGGIKVEEPRRDHDADISAEERTSKEDQL